jgi:hypothetical protein
MKTNKEEHEVCRDISNVQKSAEANLAGLGGLWFLKMSNIPNIPIGSSLSPLGIHGITRRVSYVRYIVNIM